MKKALLIAGIAAAAFATGSAQAKDSTGCGLGTMIFDGQSGIIPQVLAVTTNGTFGNQTFGITSGTLGCSQDGVITAQARLDMFLGKNLDQVASDMAAGRGETLESMASLLGIVEQDKPHFYDTTKQNFAKIFPSANVKADVVRDQLLAVMAADAVLDRYVAA